MENSGREEEVQQHDDQQAARTRAAATPAWPGAAAAHAEDAVGHQHVLVLGEVPVQARVLAGGRRFSSGPDLFREHIFQGGQCIIFRHVATIDLRCIIQQVYVTRNGFSKFRVPVHARVLAGAQRA